MHQAIAAEARDFRYLIGDKLEQKTYVQLMDEHTPYITISLDLSEPIELEDFVGFFGAISGQFDRFIRANHPDLAPDARFYVKEVRRGSIIAELFPGGISDIIGMMDRILITIAFADLVGKLVLGYVKGVWSPTATKAELKDLYKTVEALAKDTDGKATIETATYERGLWNRKVAFTFTSKEARRAARHIEAHKEDLDKTEAADHERKLMVFRQVNVKKIAVGKRTGEHVMIEDILDKELPLIYASDLAERQIKHEIIMADDNVFKKGFVVDVNVQTKGGKPAGYRVTHLHQVIDLPDDDEDQFSPNLID